MKRFAIKSVLACILSVGLLAACGGGSKGSEGGSSSQQTSTSQQTSSEASQEQSSEASQQTSSQEQSQEQSQEASSQQEQSQELSSEASAEESSEEGPTGDLAIKVWAAEGVKDMFQEQANTWAAAVKDAGGLDVRITVQAVGEGDAASNMIDDVQAGADLYCFAQDQLSRLRSAGALTEIIDEDDKALIKAQNDDVSYNAACVGDSLVAIPLTSDNGYFMYYDTELFAGHEEVLRNMTDLIAFCKENNRTIYMDATGSGWYNAAFFMAYDCTSTWETNTAGLFVDYEDNYNSPAGVKACQAMYELVKEDNVFVSGSDASKAFDGNAAVCVSGTWDSTAAKTKLGNRFGATYLPKVSVNGDEGQLGCFFGCKLLGIKPQTDTTKAVYVTELAKYFSAKDAQLARYDFAGWGPSNLEAQQEERVQNDIALTALREQCAKNCTMQGQYPDGWWTATTTLATNVQKSDGSAAAIRTILSTYAASIDSFING